jgi:hypothetical protein
MTEAVPGTTACEWCGTAFEKTQNTQRFCSVAHRQRAHNRTEKSHARHLRYYYSEKGRASDQRRQGTEKRLNSRRHHDSVNGYLTRRARILRTQRERVAAQLDELRRIA